MQNLKIKIRADRAAKRRPKTQLKIVRQSPGIPKQDMQDLCSMVSEEHEPLAELPLMKSAWRLGRTLGADRSNGLPGFRFLLKLSERCFFVCCFWAVS